MPTGDLGSGFDVAQLCVIAFVIFFFGLVFYLRREDKREGYPLKDPAGRPDQQGFPPAPAPKTFLLVDGPPVFAPHAEEEPPLPALPLALHPGYPLAATGDPLHDALGPASFALRRQQPLTYSDGKLQVLPLRVALDWSVVWEDLDPRGMDVFAGGGERIGIVTDIWVDRSVKILRYLEIDLGVAEGSRRVLAPIYFVDINPRRRRVRLLGIPGQRLIEAPALGKADEITAREEDRLNAYYAGARFYAAEARRRTPVAKGAVL